MQVEQLFPVEKTVAIISHDAGGAEILSSFAKRINNKILFCLEGPAEKIFHRKILNLKNTSLEDSVTNADYVLCGTSWQSDLEFKALNLARKLHKPSYSFIDHWVNYNQRFEREKETVLPQTIIIGDNYALDIATNLFPESTLVLIENPYFEEIKKDLNQIKIVTKKSCVLNFLYVCEPIREFSLLKHGVENYLGYVEEDALKYFLNSIEFFGSQIGSIVIRPHPSERSGKYDWVLKDYNLPLKIGGNASLLEEVCCSDIVVGCQSMAMVIGLLANKRVVSCIPPNGDPCALPYKEIEHLSKMRPMS